MEHETFQDQINLADVLILNKTDLADEASITRMEQKTTELFPSKQAVVRAVQGGFDPALLDCTGTGYSARFPSQHNETHAHSHEHNKQPDAEPLPGTPQRTGGQGFGRYTCSWLFHRDDHFDLDLISHWCRELKGLERIKGALRINQNWVLLNQVGGEQVVSPLAWRRDSRLELISTEPLDDAALEQSLLACLQSGEEPEVAWPD
jgi:G3E family GTPase